MITIMLVLTNNYPKIEDDTIISGKVVDIDEKNMTVKYEDALIKVYGDVSSIGVGDNVTLEIEYFTFTKHGNDNQFDYSRYLLSKGIATTAYIQDIKLVENKNKLYDLLYQRVDGNDKASSYAKMLLFGVKDSQVEEMYDTMSALSIVHLFALSGMHLFFMKRWMQSFLKFIVSPKYIELVTILCISLYFWIIPYSISLSRAYWMMVGFFVFKKIVSKITIFSIITIIFIYLNPYIIYNLSFIFSFFIYFLILCTDNHKNTYLILYLASIPIILSINYQLPILGLALMLICSPLVEYLYQTILWFVVFGDIIVWLVSLLIYVLESILIYSMQINLIIPFMKPPMHFIILYYILLFICIYQSQVGFSIKKSIYILISLNVILFLLGRYPPFTRVVQIDVGQGDCYLIHQAFNKGNILIDTGGSIDYDVASTVVLPYLKSVGITTLDYVFISHDDFDHSGAYDSLSNGITIKNTITTNVKKEYHIGEVEVTMLDTNKISDDKNDLSLVMHVKVDDIKYLFTGDISTSVEKQLVNAYPDLDVDILKVGHHGSNTSTSAFFLQAYQPKVALISCGLNNPYNHPHKEVIDRLIHYDIDIYRSDRDGMTSIVHVFGKPYIFR